MKRNIKYIVVHSTGTRRYEKVNDLLEKWKPKGKSIFPPFHYLIEPSGKPYHILDNAIPANDKTPQNNVCIHVAYIGGLERDGSFSYTLNKRQANGLNNLLVVLGTNYRFAEIVSPKDLGNVPENTPCFDVKKWLKGYEPDILADPLQEGSEHEHYPQASANNFFESCEILEEAA